MRGQDMHDSASELMCVSPRPIAHLITGSFTPTHFISNVSATASAPSSTVAEEDSDFDPDAAPPANDVALSSSSSSDDDADSAKPARTKTKEKLVATKRKRTYSNDDFGGEGGLIKTRAQRALEQRSKAGGVGEGKATSNVDDLWAEMNATPIRKALPAKETPSDTSRDEEGKDKSATEQPKEVLSATGERMVAIKSTYEFAGETITEEKLVPASSFTARAHQSSTASDTPSPGSGSDPSAPPRRRVPKKRASAFDAAAASRAKPAAPAKLNTLEKSRLDWAGFVDKEGIGDDLQKWNKGDKGYLERQAFLSRVEENRDQQWKSANKKS
ncbi:BCNT-domain-containing protein [Ascodesmis nigricans]|uniref:SWR1-complex protein 5 n=1 Tax=Ascodesmis nigricans TaxID=341454 RepID=A0A4S2N8W2_9PEZI|nr:BCNT-domain-containing protein [Ascodesmis nigricans]